MYGKKPPFSIDRHLRCLYPTNMPADLPRLTTPSGQNFPSLQQFSIFSLPPKQSSSISSNDMQYITPGKYAVLGFFADSHKTTETDRLMATQIGNYFCCHTCGRRPRADEKFTKESLEALTFRDLRILCKKLNISFNGRNRKEELIDKILRNQENSNLQIEF